MIRELVGGWTERRASALNQSDLLFKGSLRSSGGGVGSGRLHGTVGHDARGKLLLGPLEAGAGGAVQCVDLMTQRTGRTGVELRLGFRRSRFDFLFASCTFLNMTRDMTASEVKRAAMTIIMMPTGTLRLRPVKAEIQPLQT